MKRKHAAVKLIIRSFEPLVADVEIDSGFRTSLKTIGVLKIDDDMFVFDFIGHRGSLRDSSERDALLTSLFRGKYMPALFRNAQHNVYDKFDLVGLEKELFELRKECLFKG